MRSGRFYAAPALKPELLPANRDYFYSAATWDIQL